MHRGVAGIALAALLTAGCTSSSSPSNQALTPSPTKGDAGVWTLPDEFTAVLASFVGGDTASVKGSDGKFHVVYELWLTNGKAAPATIDKLEVLDGADHATVLQSLSGKNLLAATFTLDAQPAENDTMKLGESLLVYVELVFDSPAEVPDSIVHRFTGTAAASPASREPEKVSYLFAPWSISLHDAPVLSPPLAGDNWLAVNGCCEGRGAHRGSVQTIDGSLYNSQRFAIDWMRVDENNKLVEGDPSKPQNWNDYGAPVLAVGNATVIEVVNDLPDQPPGELPDPSTISLETVDGNHVILALGNGLFAFYAHLIKGSVTVKVGDRVTPGQVLGKLGNSGNTSAPHLHFHIMTSPSAIASDGIPYVYDAFTVNSAFSAEEWFSDAPVTGPFTPVDPAGGTGSREDELPLDLQIVSFPGP
jgi:hypothetical protein